MSDDAAWRAGTATRTITPEESMWMAGFGAREDPSRGTELDLEANALALTDGDARFVVAAVDVLGVPRDLRVAVAEACRTRFGLPPGALLLAASHTHCGPELRPERAGMANWGDGIDVDRVRAYRETLREYLVEAVGEALSDLEPASLGFNHGHAGFGTNRRYRADDGTVTHRKDPDGPADHDVPALRVDDGDGIRALAFGYACHNTTLSFNRFCGDWAGFAKETLREYHPDAVPLYLAGCAGDQNPYPRGEVVHAKAHGRTAANAVEAAVTHGSDAAERPPSMADVSGPLAFAYDTVSLAYDHVPTRAELEARLDADEEAVRNHARVLLDRLDEEESLPESYEYPVQVVRFGPDHTLVALAGEPVVSYALRLKRELPGRVWVAGYANASPGYVPTPEVLHGGGYEGEDWVYYWDNPSAFAYSTEERIVEAVHDLHDRAGR